MSTQPASLPSGENGLAITGVVTDGPDTEVVDLQSRQPDASSTTWSTVQTITTVGAQPFSATVSRDHGLEYRYRLQPTSLTTAAVSSVVTNSDPPYTLGVDSELDLKALASGPNSARVSISADPGQVVTLVVRASSIYDSWSGQVLDAQGNVIDQSLGAPGNEQTTVFAGDTIVIDTEQADEDITLWSSVPKEVPVSVGGPTVTAQADFPGQRLEFSWSVEAGDMFQVEPPDNGCIKSLTTPEGDQLPPFGATSPNLDYGTLGCDIFQSPDSGTYHFYVDTSGPVDFAVDGIARASMTEDGPAVLLHFDNAGDMAVVFFDLSDGDAVSVSPADSFRTTVLNVGATDLYTAARPGPAYVALRSQSADVDATVRLPSPVQLSGVVGGEPVPYDISGYSSRAVDLTFPGLKGEVVQQDADFTLGTLYDPAGKPVPETEDNPALFVLPSDGTYRARIWPDQAQGSIGFVDASMVDVPTDGTPTTLALSAGGYTIGRVKAPVGTTLVANVDQVDSSLGNAWRVWLQRPDTAVYGTWTQDPTIPSTEWNPPGTAEPFTIEYFDDAYFILSASNDTAAGAVQVSVDPASNP